VSESSQKVRAYHLLPTGHALENLRHRRLKIAQLDDLNDPFELWAFAQPDRKLREGLRSWKKEMARKFGMVCFSLSWHNPLLWSHYADRHRGIALAFDVNGDILKRVAYAEARPNLHEVNLEAVQCLLFTKFIGWRYEDEARIFTRLEEPDPDSGLYFAEFNEHVVLREVIVGPLCEVTRRDLQKILATDEKDVKLIKARLAFNSFRIVSDQRGLR